MSKPRYFPTRMVKDPKAPKRYQRSGWMAFDSLHRCHGQVWPTKAEAQRDADRLNRANSTMDSTPTNTASQPDRDAITP